MVGAIESPGGGVVVAVVVGWTPRARAVPPEHLQGGQSSLWGLGSEPAFPAHRESWNGPTSS